MAARILYVEDNENDVLLLRHAMRKAGFSADVEVFYDGDCLEHLRVSVREGKPLPNLILLDLRTRPMAGNEILKRLQSIPQLHRIPRVIFSSAMDSADEGQLFSDGAMACIRKPSGGESWVTVAEQISNLLARR